MKKNTSNSKEKTLIIAEKPSVAKDITKALGGFTEKDGYYESFRYIVASAQGHLLEFKDQNKLCPLDGKFKYKILEELPYIKEDFELGPVKKASQKLALLKKLIGRKDVTELINACDAGREGELIFREIVEYTKAQQPIKRLWLQSMTTKAIREAFKNLRTDEEMLPLAEAAKCRAIADWLVGINLTRATTAYISNEAGSFLVSSIGRVQTPTLAMIVQREKQIREFTPQDYWEIHATFRCDLGTYEGRWINPEFKKEKNNPTRIWNHKEVEAITADCQGKTGVVSETSRNSSQSAPALFDLTNLQREANIRFGYSAKRTLDIAQRLYDTHKAITYPRTDSRYLPEDYPDVCADIMESLRNNYKYKSHAEYLLSNAKKFMIFDAPAFNDKNISDHFAIIPTTTKPSNLREDELRIYDLIVRRFLANFYLPAVYRITTRHTDIGGHRFETIGKTLIQTGWRALYHNDAATPRPKNLVSIENNESVSMEQIQPDQKQTTPPSRYTEATLLSAMEHAGRPIITPMDPRLIDPLLMIPRGLGTPATRADIIEKLLNKFLQKNGRFLIPTDFAMSVIELLEVLDMDNLTKADLTEEWEIRLNNIKEGEVYPGSFTVEIMRMVSDYVEKFKEGKQPESKDYAMKTPCPNCKGTIHQGLFRIYCPECGLHFSRIPGKRLLSDAEIEELLTNRQVGPFDNFISKKGKPFKAILELADNKQGNLKLDWVFAPFTKKSDLAQSPVVGKCPKCNGKIYNSKFEYICEHAVKDDGKCDFCTEKTFYGRSLDAVQMAKLLSEGKTDLLDGFQSKHGKSSTARLVLDENKKIKREFPQKLK